jgi:hypothetical protein
MKRVGVGTKTAPKTNGVNAAGPHPAGAGDITVVENTAGGVEARFSESRIVT